MESGKIPTEFSGYKMLLVTDFHSAEFGIDNSRLVRKIKEVNPDVVLLGGDMVNSQEDDGAVFLSLCDRIASDFETYYIFGNHELIQGEDFCHSLESKLQNVGVNCLNNKSTTLKKGNSEISLYGLWFNLRYYQSADAEEKYDFEISSAETLLGKSSDGFNILLTHSPTYFDTYSEWGADLTLAGHMHGGMIRLPFSGGVFSPEKDFFPEYDAGLFENGENKMIVSRGLGNGHAGFRVFNPPEIVIIELKSD
ncbi:MAG: metallophosphoesterase [Clostridia bacterium]|nr:metallophosphoesterase [Clostridia bacterium]